MLTLYHSPGSCSNGILLLLEEVGADYELEIVDIRKGAQKEASYLARNPKGKVPALLRHEGPVLTEFPAIAYWLSQNFSEAGLWPEDLETQCRTIEALDYIVSSVHMRGFTFVKVPAKFQLDEKATEDLRAFGRSEVEKGLSQLSKMLGEAPYLLGKFGVADAAMFYVLCWAEQEGFEIARNLQDFLGRIRERPAAQRAFADS